MDGKTLYTGEGTSEFLKSGLQLPEKMQIKLCRFVSNVFRVSNVFAQRTRCRFNLGRAGTRRALAQIRDVRHRSQRSQGPTCSSLAPIGSWSTFVEDVSRRRADLAAGSAQTTGAAPCRTVRPRAPQREVGAARHPRRARRWSSCCRRLSCVASLTDEWSTRTEHNIALGNQVESSASIAGKAPPAEATAASRPPATLPGRVA